MATIVKRQTKDGETYRVSIRRKGIEVSKTFFNEEDAKIYEFYKERLIDNIEAFDVPVKDRVTLTNIMELKIETINKTDRRTLGDYRISTERLNDVFGTDRFYHEITPEEWLEGAKKMLNMDVYKGAKTENGKRKMSLATLRKIFAHASSAVSHAKFMGISLENHPLNVTQTFIVPAIRGPEVSQERQRELLETASKLIFGEPGPKLHEKRIH